MLSKLLFSYVNPLVRTGRKKVLEVADMPELEGSLDPRHAAQSFADLPSDSWWALLKGVLKAQRRQAVLIVTFLMLTATLRLASPVLIHQILGYIEAALSGETELWLGIAMAVTLCLTNVGNALASQHYIHQAVSSQIIAVNGLNYAIYRHALRLTRRARMRSSIGDMVNHIGSDADAVSVALRMLGEIFFAVLTIVSVTAVLFYFLGAAAFAAVAVMAVITPLTRFTARRFARLDLGIMARRDERVGFMSQVLSGMRIVKYFAWESRILEQVQAVRTKEIDGHRHMARSKSFALLLYMGGHTVVSLAAFGTYLWLGHELDASTVFSCLALFGILEGPFRNLPNNIAEFSTAKVGAERIAAFLRSDTYASDERAVSAAGRAVGVTLRDVDGCYEDATEPVIRRFSFAAEPGESVAVVGPVGAGKSSLLLALLGELPVVGGELTFTGISQGEAPRMAFVPQEAYTLNATLEDNIRFGADRELIPAALHAVALEYDVAKLASGLDTEIGEQGINLSGGQRQRVSLARAMVSEPGIVLLDDPLSAVDYETEALLVERLIFGAWQDITRIVVTHRLAHLARFDRILFVEEGEIVAAGTLKELLLDSPRFRDFYAEQLTSESHVPDVDQEIKKIVRAGQAPAPATALAKTPGKGQRITDDEDREVGAVKPTLYLRYFKALGGASLRERSVYLPLLVVSAVLVTALPILQNTWLSVWMDQQKGGASWLGSWVEYLSGDSMQNMIIFALLGALTLAGVFGQQLLWAFRAVAAAKLLHDRALEAVFRTKIRFFDATPVGRVLNRFSRDLDAVERELSWTFQESILAVVRMLGSIAVMLTVFPLMIAVVIPVMGLYYRLQNSYRASGREAKRLMAITRSPRFAHFKETLDGLTVIRGYHRDDLFTERFFDTLGENQRMFQAMVLLNRWFSIRIPLLSAVVSLAITVSLIVSASHGLIAAGIAGLVLVYALQFSERLDTCVRQFSEAEAKMTAVERLAAFSDLEPEPSCTVANAALPERMPWPRAGAIEFDGVVASYAPHLPAVLKGASFTVPARAKVGIIGRTGAGKSTIFQLLFRFITPSAGRILIDGIDIGMIPLERLRRSLAIIPQDPTLFKGKLRENLDRFGLYRDDEIWSVLEKVKLARFVASLPGGLEADVKENGKNFSQGQRQLFCLARALLCQAKIIVMDEATASVDVETDAMIQQTIAEQCTDVTVLIIAHRLGTVENCDLVVELADGQVRSVFKPEPALARRPDRASRTGRPRLTVVSSV